MSGPAQPQRAVIVSIPHAGRYYPPALLGAVRVTGAVLQRLEDRYVDLLAKGLGAQGYRAITAIYARAWIDMNRAEDEWDSSLIVGGTPAHPVSKRVHGGLGIIPRRLHGPGELWRHRFDHADLSARIEQLHRPYHAAIAGALDGAIVNHGQAVLIDLHSMPRQPDGVPQLVLGDRYGLTASSQLVDRLMAVGEGLGLSVARNAPYAGAHTIERHASRTRRIEAVQVEIDRSLYLDAAMEPASDGVRAMAPLIERIVHEADDYVQSLTGYAQAAE
jgi:N-formylglutamate amidohydrolase